MAELRVQVCYARPERQILMDIMVAQGSTLRQAIDASGMLAEAPEIDLDQARVGIHGKVKTLDTVLREGDRVEIYRPLIADPMESRRRRAEKKRD
ncbi:RnfH family protein [Noviherbaspirillum galbum]|uniref:UPF0125 protein G3574_01530 n=1 Tax=Noviherbaspirillum galbum TaxID=2709383 RepID=A0A6B3SGG3_9BURK|nr:RnfH family protein [Noviherbaspirillum galbum]NEX59748.1 RnfH family protein [Noviherbaspirillum galbum]